MTAAALVPESFMKKYGLLITVAAMAAIVMAPTPEGLPIAGQRMLALLVFAVFE